MRGEVNEELDVVYSACMMSGWTAGMLLLGMVGAV